MNKEVWFIADLFLEDVPQGGAELVNRQIVNILKSEGYNINEIYSFKVSEAFLKNHENSFFILAGFIRMPIDALEYMCNVNYILYEHDHKYVINRNPAAYKDFLIPAQQLVYQDIYSHAVTVVCQSSLHEKILKINMPNITTKNMGGSLWEKETLDQFKKLRLTNKNRNNRCAIVQSDNPIKGQVLAEKYCRDNNLEYDLISAPNSLELFKKFLSYDTLVYFPTSPETFSRVLMEAKLAGCKIRCNNLIGALSEDYSWQDLERLQSEIIAKEDDAREYLKSTIDENMPPPPNRKSSPEEPLVSILTSVYNGEKYLDSFLAEISKQTYFNKCELILVDCNEKETKDKLLIDPYLKKYSNIHYFKLDKDPGVYGAWNFAIKNSSGKFLTNANLDDSRAYENIEVMVSELEKDPTIDLVYAPFFVTQAENETFYSCASRQVYETYEFSPQLMKKCLPGCMPVWRKSLHEKNGLFDESYKSAGDWEFWLRCVQAGSSFKRVNQILGLYYFNPEGLSTSQSNNQKKQEEEHRVLALYGDFLDNEKNYSL